MLSFRLLCSYTKIWVSKVSGPKQGPKFGWAMVYVIGGILILEPLEKRLAYHELAIVLSTVC